MPQEIERKFLVTGDGWRQQAKGVLYRQGYLTHQSKATVRVRIAGNQGYLTIKGPMIGITRPEFEYPIPLHDAETILDSLCSSPLIEKYRYRIAIGNHVWEVDEFLGDNSGLVLAEVELTSETDDVEMPSWVGEDVSHDVRYLNSNLARTPFKRWQ